MLHLTSVSQDMRTRQRQDLLRSMARAARGKTPTRRVKSTTRASTLRPGQSRASRHATNINKNPRASRHNTLTPKRTGTRTLIPHAGSITPRRTGQDTVPNVARRTGERNPIIIIIITTVITRGSNSTSTISNCSSRNWVLEMDGEFVFF